MILLLGIIFFWIFYENRNFSQMQQISFDIWVMETLEYKSFVQWLPREMISHINHNWGRVIENDVNSKKEWKKR